MKLLIKDAVNILSESSNIFDINRARLIIEDTTSPISMRFSQKLYDAVLSKSHIDFDDIPKSMGDITKYSGYKTMVDTLDMITTIKDYDKSNCKSYVETIRQAIGNISSLRNIYNKGFTYKNEYIMLEYSSYVYTCVEATTSILYQFVDMVKKPVFDETYTLEFKNTKYRADLFYIEQLEKYNNVNKTMHSEYVKFLTSMLNKDTNNFVGTSVIVGAAFVAAVAMSIIPVTRLLVNHFYTIRHKISVSLAYQAYLLEMNKISIENNSSFSKEKKADIIKKQEEYRVKLQKISDSLRLSAVETAKKREKNISEENKSFTSSKIREEIDNGNMGDSIGLL